MDNPEIYAPPSPEVLAFWGAGATQALGFLTTGDLGQVFSDLVGWTGKSASSMSGPRDYNYHRSISARIDGSGKLKSLTRKRKETLRSLLILLGDGDGEKDFEKAEVVRRNEMERVIAQGTSPAFLRQFGISVGEDTKTDKRIFRSELEEWPMRYDWRGIRQILPLVAHGIWIPNKSGDHAELAEFYTVLEQLLQLDGGVRCWSLFGDSDDNSQLDPLRLPRIRDAATILTGVFQRLVSTDEEGSFFENKVRPYRRFVEALVRLNVEEAADLHKQGHSHNRRAFYMSSLALVSTNWDPTLQWFWFYANHEFNSRASKGMEGTIAGSELNLYHDQGSEMLVRPIDRWNVPGRRRADVFFSMTEQAAQRLNDPENRRSSGKDNPPLYRLNKLLQMHGGFQWRDCPRCGRVSTTAPAEWRDTDGSMMGPSLLPDLCSGWKPVSASEHADWRRGRYSVVQCPYCDYHTYAGDAAMLMQTAIKPTRHYFLWSNFREMGALAEKAKHIVLIGYSLPPDDLLNRCFLQSSGARRGQEGTYEHLPFVTVVDFDKHHQVGRFKKLDKDNVWDYLSLDAVAEKASQQSQTVVKSVLQVFGTPKPGEPHRFRVFLGGFPSVLSDLGNGDIAIGTRELFYPSNVDEDFGIRFPIQRPRHD